MEGGFENMQWVTTVGLHVQCASASIESNARQSKVKVLYRGTVHV